MIPPVVVIVDECSDRLEQFAGHFVGNQFYLSFDGTVCMWSAKVGQFRPLS
jgi:hypothetical protein